MWDSDFTLPFICFKVLGIFYLVRTSSIFWWTFPHATVLISVLNTSRGGYGLIAKYLRKRSKSYSF